MLSNLTNQVSSPVWLLALLVAAVSIAAVWDYRSRRIPNGITVPTAAAGLALHAAYSGWGGVYFSLSGLLLGVVCFLVFYLLGGIGGGDVKLMGSVGSVMGADGIIVVFLMTGLTGGLMSMAAMWKRSRKPKIRPRSRIQLRQDVEEKAGTTIPYGVAIAVGTTVAVLLHIFSEVQAR